MIIEEEAIQVCDLKMDQIARMCDPNSNWHGGYSYTNERI